MEKCHDRSSRRDDDDNSNNATSKGKEMWMSCCKQYGRAGPALGCSSGGGGFSWLQRSYSCSFCKREFRSAQALGGHMNVHRRDKARLRASPPLDLGSSPFNPNPNPNHGSTPPPTTSSSSSSFYPIPNLNLPPPPPNATAVEDCEAGPPAAVISKHPSPAIYWSSSPGEDLKAAERGKLLSTNIIRECMDVDKEEMPEESVVKRGKLVNLDLEIGFFGDHGDHGLDLELRLGYTN